MKKLFLVGALILGAFAMQSFTVEHDHDHGDNVGYVCSIDDFPLYSTGRSKVVNGRFFYQYKCVSNHYYWIRG